ncbi:MAG TPA: tetratricopeptide repeat protein [Candidatus Eisenbacteria bacterium]|nr:tetratricopeptide repeat protein [Candidatus Eisenbacteria bacterium]
MSGLTPQQVEFARANARRMSARQIAKQLNVPRVSVEECLRGGRGGPAAGTAVSAAPKAPKAVLAGLVMLAAFAAFSSSLVDGFVWDDQQMILQDKTLEDPSHFFRTITKPIAFYGQEKPKGALWRAVVSATLFADVAAWGKKNAFGFHLTNVLLHTAVAGVFFVTAMRFLDPWPAFFAALFFAVHPVHSESVSYITVRSEILCGLFSLTCLLLHRRSVWIAALAYLLAMYSKETGVTFGGVLLAYDWYARREKDWSPAAFVRRYGPYAAAVAVYFATRFYFIGGLGSAAEGDTTHGFYAWPNRIWMQPVYYGHYMRMIFFPSNLHTWRQLRWPHEFTDPGYFWPFLAFAALAAVCAWTAARSRPYAAGVFWFFLSLLPVINLLVIVNSLVHEHWLYNPLMGLTLVLFGVLWERVFRGNVKAMAAVALPVVAVLGAVAFRQNLVWKDEITLFEHTIRYVTRDPLIYSNLGVAYVKNNQPEKAEWAFHKALEIDPQYENALYNLDLLRRQRQAA